MPRQNKCSYCHTEGHNISHCDSERGNRLFNHIRSIAIDYIVLERRTIHERSIMFYEYLRNIYYDDELKLLLSKVQCRIHGNKKQRLSRFINNYFIRELVDGPYSRHLEYNERVHIAIYSNYWRLLSEGKLIEANEELNRYLILVNQVHPNPHILVHPDIFRLAQPNHNNQVEPARTAQPNHNNQVEPARKFPINVIVKTIDLTEEEPTQSFECAICMEEECPILEQVELGCGHSFCSNCITQMLTNSQKNKKHPRCGLCRADFKNTQVHTLKIMQDYNTRFCFPIIHDFVFLARNIVR